MDVITDNYWELRLSC